MFTQKNKVIPQAIGVIFSKYPSLSLEQIQFALYYADRACLEHGGYFIIGGRYIATDNGPQIELFCDPTPELDRSRWGNLSPFTINILNDAATLASVRGWRQIALSLPEYRLAIDKGYSEISVESILAAVGCDPAEIEDTMRDLEESEYFNKLFETNATR